MREPAILIVDDQLANRRFVSDVLTAACWTVIEASDGTEAVGIATTRVPDLIIMDIVMPRGDGITATRMIRADPSDVVASIPILAYTAARFDDAALGHLGMDGQIAKPCTPDMLVAAAARWWPDGEMAGVQRLRRVFGEDDMATLVAGFRDHLAAAVAELDRGVSTATAHRVAGIAGTLGFKAVSSSWLRLADGETAARSQARRDARIAIAQIDRERQEDVRPHSQRDGSR